MPQITVVTPVFNRPDKLERALRSVASQTLSDFECLVVDDGSEQSPVDIVAGLGDNRFKLIQRAHNGGCTAARMDGFKRATGDYATTLDSDNELYPWTLERSIALLEESPDIDCATGLYVFPDGLRMRITNGRRVVSPPEFCRRSLRGSSDCVGVVRRSVVDEWAHSRDDFFNLDFHLWFGMSLSHRQLYVDEPWGQYHEDAADRISLAPDPRVWTDIAKFTEAYRPRVGASPCAPLDDYLRNAWFKLRRAKRTDELELVEDWMRIRGLTRATALQSSLSFAVKRRVTKPQPVWI